MRKRCLICGYDMDTEQTRCPCCQRPLRSIIDTNVNVERRTWKPVDTNLYY